MVYTRDKSLQNWPKRYNKKFEIKVLIGILSLNTRDQVQ